MWSAPKRTTINGDFVRALCKEGSKSYSSVGGEREKNPKINQWQPSFAESSNGTCMEVKHKIKKYNHYDIIYNIHCEIPVCTLIMKAVVSSLEE